RCVRFHPDGQLFAAADLGGDVRVYGLDGTVHAAFSHDGGVWSLEFSRDGERILTASWDKTARVHDLHGRLLRTMRGRTASLQHPTCSPDEQWIATGSTDRSVRLWRAVDPEFAVHFGQTNCVRAMAFAPDGSTLLVGSADGVVHEYGAEKRQLRAGVGTTGINRIAFSPRGTSIAVAHVDHTFTLWPNRRADPARLARPRTPAT